MQTVNTPVAFSGTIPLYYDDYLGPMFFEPYAIEMANRLRKLSVKNVLELASGTGRLTKLLPGATRGASILASDINPAMVTYGRKMAMDPSVKWMELDAVSLPFPDNSYDCVVVQFGVMFYSDRVKAFQEAYRVLKPGGTFIFNCWDEIKFNPMANLANETLKHFFPVDTPAFYKVPFSYFDERKIVSDLNEAGFKNMKIEVVKLIGSSDFAMNAAKGLIEGTPTVTAIRERDESKLPEVLNHLEKLIINEFGSMALDVPLQARVVAATKS